MKLTLRWHDDFDGETDVELQERSQGYWRAGRFSSSLRRMVSRPRSVPLRAILLLDVCVWFDMMCAFDLVRFDGVHEVLIRALNGSTLLHAAAESTESSLNDFNDFCPLIPFQPLV